MSKKQYNQWKRICEIQDERFKEIKKCKNQVLIDVGLINDAGYQKHLKAIASM